MIIRYGRILDYVETPHFIEYPGLTNNEASPGWFIKSGEHLYTAEIFV